MQQDDDTLRERVVEAWPDADAPAFDAAWQAAKARRAAAVVAAVTVAISLQAPPEPSYIEVAELLETTYWTAPSDALLPERSFDIYQELPVIFESTELDGGTLL